MRILATNRVAIKVTYYPPTNHLGARYKADAGDRRVCWVSADYELMDDGNRDAAAVALVNKMGWGRNTVLVRGQHGYDSVYLMVPEDRL